MRAGVNFPGSWDERSNWAVSPKRGREREDVWRGLGVGGAWSRVGHKIWGLGRTSMTLSGISLLVQISIASSAATSRSCLRGGF